MEALFICNNCNTTYETLDNFPNYREKKLDNCIKCCKSDKTTTTVNNPLPKPDENELNKFPRRCFKDKCTLKHIEQNKEQFIGEKGITKWCLTCRTKQKELDENRKNNKENIKKRKEKDRIRHINLMEKIKQMRKECEENQYVCSEKNCKNPLTNIEEFYNNNDERFYEQCIDCRKYNLEKSKNYRDKNKDNKDYKKRVFLLHKLWKENNPEKIKEYNETRRLNINDRIKNFIYKANNKGLEWNLDNETAEFLMKMPCNYCGEIPNLDIKLGSIDRIDSSKGYNKDNVCSCCYMCNMMKNNMSVEQFIKIIRHITTFKFKEEYPFLNYNYNIAFDTCKGNHLTYNIYKNRCNERKINFNLSVDEFNNLLKGSCYLCGKTNINEHKNGIDRIDSNKDYVIDNCKTCCKSCNYVKKEYNLDKFYNKCLRITLFNEN